VGWPLQGRRQRQAVGLPLFGYFKGCYWIHPISMLIMDLSISRENLRALFIEHARYKDDYLQTGCRAGVNKLTPSQTSFCTGNSRAIPTGWMHLSGHPGVWHIYRFKCIGLMIYSLLPGE
jgi:hypothetical protein